MASTCCVAAGAPLKHEYSPKGSLVTLDKSLPAYKVGSGTVGIVVVPDIFSFPGGPGFTGAGYKQILQVADRLAEDVGAVVLIFDPFRGHPWPMDKFPPKPQHNIGAWFADHTYKQVSPDVDIAVAHLKSSGVQKLGIMGYCWGSSIAFPAAGQPGVFSAVAGIHPAFFDKEQELVGPVQCPVMLLPADGDVLESVKVITDTKPFAKDCVYHRFSGQVHGFLAARGDWNKPEVAAAAGQAVGMLADFFKKHLKGTGGQCTDK